jgi:FkbM family methyltransferase
MRTPISKLARALALSREDLSFSSQLARRVGLDVRPRFCGVLLAAPDASTAWTVALQIASGDYRWPGLTPEPGWHVVDVGANIGAFSLWAERLGAEVVAYEPEPKTYESLVANVAGRRVSTRQAALVGEAAPAVRLYLSGVRSTRHTLLAKEIESGAPLRDFVDVPTVTVADVVGDGCDLLKLDCEGAEFEALLRSDDETLRSARRLVVEYHRIGGEPEELVDRLEAAGLEVSVLWTSEAVGAIGARLPSPAGQRPSLSTES